MPFGFALPAAHTFRGRVMRAGILTMGGYIVSQALRLGSNLIMTRLLVPEMYGVMALAHVLLTGLSMISDVGLRTNVVQSRRGEDSSFLNTLWTVQILRGALIWLTALGVAVAVYWLARNQWWVRENVYSDPVLPFVIGILAFDALISGFESTRIATANRNLALWPITWIDFVCQIAGLTLMIVWAILDRSIWALVAGNLFSSILRVLLSHSVLPGKSNRLYWDWSACHEIFRFGKWVFASSLLGFLATSGDRLLLGALTDSATLGLYAIGFFSVATIGNVFTRLMSQVAFPALAEIVRERRDALKESYYKFRKHIDIALLPAIGFLFSAGHIIVDVLYDDRYLPAGHMLEILSISLVAVPYRLASQCFLALGKPQLLIPIVTAHLLGIYGLLPAAYFYYGLEGALWAIGSSILLSLPVVIFLLIRNGLFDIYRELQFIPLLLVGYVLGWFATELWGVAS